MTTASLPEAHRSGTPSQHFDLSPLAMMRLSTDGRVLLVNDATCALLGRP
ncbi:MAG: hypothetical protein QOD70_2612, partial [Frankiales bacterium]|nr:hypothetical protein [Frankiales bacterium]